MIAYLECIESEPARPIRLFAMGIDGNQLKIKPLAEPQKAVMRSHRLMLAAR